MTIDRVRDIWLHKSLYNDYSTDMFFKADRINVTTLYIDKRDRLLFNLLCIVQGLICFYYLTFQ